MDYSELTRYLYHELLALAIVILTILLVNNIVLYKLKLKDYLSIMLISSIVECLAEFVWDICAEKPNLIPILYGAIFTYVLAIMVVSATFNRYFLYRLGVVPSSRVIDIVLYVVPCVVVFIVAVSSIWTKLMFWVEDTGYVAEGPLVSGLFMPLALIYLTSVLLFAIYHAIRDRKDNPELARTSRQLVIFAVLALSVFAIQSVILGDYAEDFLILGIPWSISLLYLVTTVNTDALLENQAQMEAVEADLRTATKIQTDALPPATAEFVDHYACTLRASMDTAREVGGDFYDYFAIDEKHLCFLIADVSGKGIPAALFMMTAKTTIKDYALMHTDTAEIFTFVNERLCENNETSMFATAWIGIYNTETRVLQYTNAGHNYPLLMRPGEKIEELRVVHGLFLGGIEGVKYKSDELVMEPGNRILLFTDGINEAINLQEEQYGNDRLFAAFEGLSEASNEDVLTGITDSVLEFVGEAPQFDDMTMMIVTAK